MIEPAFQPLFGIIDHAFEDEHLSVAKPDAPHQVSIGPGNITR